MITLNAVGRLTKDCDLQYTKTGTPVANFTLACKRKRIDNQGNKQTTYVKCVLWGKIAEGFAQYTRKGSLVSAIGELVSRQYDDQQGITHYVSEMNVESFDFLESKETIQNREHKIHDAQHPPIENNDMQEPPATAESAEPYYGPDAPTLNVDSAYDSTFRR